MSEPRAAVFFRPNNARGVSDAQVAELAKIAFARGWSVVATFITPGLDALLQAAAQRQFDIVAAPSLDLLGHSLHQVVETVRQLRRHGIHLYVHEAGIDTTSPAGPAVLSVFAAIAACERAHIRERARVSLERARRTGTKIGRPSNLNESVRAAIIALRARDLSIRCIAAQLRVGVSTVYRVLEAQA